MVFRKTLALCGALLSKNILEFATSIRAGTIKPLWVRRSIEFLEDKYLINLVAWALCFEDLAIAHPEASSGVILPEVPDGKPTISQLNSAS